MATILAELRSNFTGLGLNRLNSSQRAWEMSMLKDVDLSMGVYEGGSAAGPLGAKVRARSEAQRTTLLNELRDITK